MLLGSSKNSRVVFLVVCFCFFNVEITCRKKTSRTKKES